MDNTPKTLAKRLRNHAAPDPHDERPVMHAALLLEAANEIDRLRRIEDAADDYYDRYMQDEASEDFEEWCGCEKDQHDAAVALKVALGHEHDAEG